MRNQQDGAGEIFQHLLQRLARGDVEVVGGLIQHQKVGALQRQQCQRQAGALAARERADLLEDVLAAEQVGRQVAAGGLGVHLLAQLQLFQHAALAVQAVVRLGKVAHLHAGAQFDLAFQRLDLAQHGLDERGLAAAVGADQRGALAAVQLQVARGEQAARGVADGELPGAHDDGAGDAGGCQARLDARRAAVGQRDGVHLAHRLDHVQRAVGVQVELVPLFAVAQRQHAKALDDGQLAGEDAQAAQRAGVRALAHPVALDEIDLVEQAFLLFLIYALVVIPALLPLQQVG